MREAAPGRPEVVRILAPNPGPMTLAGTNTYVVGREPAWVIDPGPDERAHLAAVRAEAEARGGIGGVLITHGHLDHTAGVASLDAEVVCGSPGGADEGAELLAAAGAGEAEPAPTTDPDPDRRVGPFLAIHTPGHASDHLAFVLDGDGRRVVFCGDLVLGEGSSIVPPRTAGGSLADYMASLGRVEGLKADLLAPGHGPWITDPARKLAEYRAHRLERERDLLAALGRGERSRRALLAAAWSDVPEPMLPAAAVAMQAHLEKLAGDGVPLDGLVP